jgi:hypothetical protein
MRRCSGRIAGSLVGPWLTILAQMLLITMMEAPCHGWTVRQRHSRLLPWIHRPATHDRNNNEKGLLPPVVAPTTRPEQAKQEQVTNDHTRYRSSDGSSSPPLGWTREVQRRDPPSSKTHICHVTVGSCIRDGSDNDTVTFPLPIVPHDDSLATAVWPAGLAAAILCQQASGSGGLRALLQRGNGATVLELGAGLGIFGLTAAQYAANVLLTDQDATVIAAMQQQSANRILPDHVQANQLDWRDNEPNGNNTITTPVDVVIGSDVAYYYHLLRPLMDTAQSFFKPNTGSLFLVVGQANRKSLWDLYHNIVQGCYNQRTDVHEPPWPGIADVRLFRLHLEDWVEDEQQLLRPSDDNNDDDGNHDNDDQKNQHPPITTRIRTIKKVDYEDIPIAVLVYQSPGFVALERLTEQDDYIATPADFVAMEMSF